VRPLSVGKVLTSNTATTLYTVPTGYYATCTLLHATNSTASNKHISFAWYDASATTSIPLTFEYTITSKSNFDPISENQAFVMEEGDYITATSETGSTMSVVATFEVQGAQRT
jgi:hypothetical protein